MGCNTLKGAGKLIWRPRKRKGNSPTAGRSEPPGLHELVVREWQRIGLCWLPSALLQIKVPWYDGCPKCIHVCGGLLCPFNAFQAGQHVLVRRGQLGFVCLGPIDRQPPARRVRVAEPRRSRMRCFRVSRSEGFVRSGLRSGRGKMYPDINRALIPGRSAESRALSSSPSIFGRLRSAGTASIAPRYLREIPRASSPSRADRIW